MALCKEDILRRQPSGNPNLPKVFQHQQDTQTLTNLLQSDGFRGYRFAKVALALRWRRSWSRLWAQKLSTTSGLRQAPTAATQISRILARPVLVGETRCFRSCGRPWREPWWSCVPVYLLSRCLGRRKLAGCSDVVPEDGFCGHCFPASFHTRGSWLVCQGCSNKT